MLSMLGIGAGYARYDDIMRFRNDLLLSETSTCKVNILTFTDTPTIPQEVPFIIEVLDTCNEEESICDLFKIRIEYIDKFIEIYLSRCKDPASLKLYIDKTNGIGVEKCTIDKIAPHIFKLTRLFNLPGIIGITIKNKLVQSLCSMNKENLCESIFTPISLEIDM